MSSIPQSTQEKVMHDGNNRSSDPHSIIPYYEEYEAGGDVTRNYGKYASSVEKVLRSFEGVEEWTDLISALSRLSKTLATNSRFPVIPHRIQVSRCLANCLTKTYPAGVHKKALEVYINIFRNNTAYQAVEDLPMWTLGLLPFSEISSLTVKSLLLTIYRDHLLCLGESLVPCLKGIVLSIMPLIEEEAGEIVGEGLNILEKLRNITGNDVFYPTFWLCIVSSTHIRTQALKYILRVCPKASESLDNTILDVRGENLGLLVLSLKLMLCDNSVLVSRGALDILCKHFPLEKSILPREEALTFLVTALQLFQTGDISLIRRVKAWLQGNTRDVDQNLQEKTLSLLMEAVKIILESSNPNDSHSLVRPYKIIPEVLAQLSIDPESLLKIYTIILLYYKKKYLQTRLKTVIVKHAFSLFENTSESIFWNCLNSLISECSLLNSETSEIMETILFYLIKPTLSHLFIKNRLLLFLNNCIVALGNMEFRDILYPRLIDICNYTLSHLVTLNNANSVHTDDQLIGDTEEKCFKQDMVEDQDSVEYLTNIKYFYVHILSQISNIIISLLKTEQVIPSDVDQNGDYLNCPYTFHLVCLLNFAHRVILLVSKHGIDDNIKLKYLPKMKILVELLSRSCSDLYPFPVLYALFQCVYSSIVSFSGEEIFKFSDQAYENIAKTFVRLTWKFFYRDQVIYATEAAELISMLCTILNPADVEYHVLSVAKHNRMTDYYGTIEAMGIFISSLAARKPATNILFPRICHVIAKYMSHDDNELNLRASYALSIYTKAHKAILDPLLCSLLSKSIIRTLEIITMDGRKMKIYYYNKFENTMYIYYTLRALYNYLNKYAASFLYTYCTKNLMIDPCSNGVLSSTDSVNNLETERFIYGDIILYIALLFIYSQPFPDALNDQSFSNANVEIHKESLKIISKVLSSGGFPRVVVSTLETLLCFRLLHYTSDSFDNHPKTQVLETLTLLQSTNICFGKGDSNALTSDQDPVVKWYFFNTINFLKNHITEPDVINAVISGRMEPINFIVLECFETSSRKNTPLYSVGAWVEYFSSFSLSSPSQPLDLHYKAALIVKDMLASSNKKFEDILCRFNPSTFFLSSLGQAYMPPRERLYQKKITSELSLCISDIHCIMKLILKFSYLMRYDKPGNTQNQKEDASWISSAKLKVMKGSIFDFENNIAKYIGYKTSNTVSRSNSNILEVEPEDDATPTIYGEYTKKSRVKVVNLEKFTMCIVSEIFTLHSLLSRLSDIYEQSSISENSASHDNNSNIFNFEDYYSYNNQNNNTTVDKLCISKIMTLIEKETDAIVSSLHAIGSKEFCSCMYEIWCSGDAEFLPGQLQTSSPQYGQVLSPDSFFVIDIKHMNSMKLLEKLSPFLKKSLILYAVEMLKTLPIGSASRLRTYNAASPPESPATSVKDRRLLLTYLIGFLCYLLKYTNITDISSTSSEFFSTIRGFLTKCKYSTIKDFPDGSAIIFYAIIPYVNVVVSSEYSENVKVIKDVEETLVKTAEFCSNLMLSAYGSYNLSTTITKCDDSDQHSISRNQKPNENHHSLTLQRCNSTADLNYILSELDVFYDAIVGMTRINSGNVKFISTLQIIFNTFLSAMLKSGTISNNLIYNKLLKIIKEITKISNIQKTWKPVILEKFFSNDFFSTDKLTILMWIQILNTLTNDKLVIKDVISRVNKAPTSNLFSSREHDIQIKSYSIKRLAFCIMSGTQNKLYDHIPGIREKFIALLKCKEDILRPQIYLLARVVMIKFKRSPFSTVWSIIFSELIELFARCISKGIDQSQLGNLYAALKLLDQAVVMRLTDIQWHQWVFFDESRGETTGSYESLDTQIYQPLLTRLKYRVEMALLDESGSYGLSSKGADRCTQTISTFNMQEHSITQEEHAKITSSIASRCNLSQHPQYKSKSARLSLRKTSISTIEELLDSINASICNFTKTLYTSDSSDMEDIVNSLLSEFSNTDFINETSYIT